jgi:hypothetical protein
MEVKTGALIESRPMKLKIGLKVRFNVEKINASVCAN